MCICNGGTPYFIKSYYSLSDAKIALYSMVDFEKSRNRAYYVDNDFFDNEFPYNVQYCKYFCIKEREVSDWKKSSDFKTNRSKIIYFNKIS